MACSNKTTKLARTKPSVGVSPGKPWPTIAAVATIVVLAGVVFGYLALQTTKAGDGEAAKANAVVARSERPFGQHYRQLEQRDRAAFSPETRGAGPHVHPEISVFANGKPIEVPANIGIYPDKQGPFGTPHVPVHTHDTSGTIHLEGVTEATLGQFFQVWGVTLSPTQLGHHEATGDKSVRMWVNGTPSRAFGQLQLTDGQRITVAYGDTDAPPPAGVSAAR